MPGRSLKDQFPFRLIVGSEDLTFLLDDGFTFSSVDPGGFESASFSVPKDLPQTLRGTYVRLDCGLQVAFEGRVSQIQRSLGARTQIQCEGYGALLKDNEASMIFCDRDLTHWQGISAQRNIDLVGGGWSIGQPQLMGDSQGDPTLTLGFTDNGSKSLSDAVYDAGPQNHTATFYYDTSVLNIAVSDPDWKMACYYDTNDSSRFNAAQLIVNLTSNSELTGYATVPAKRFVLAEMFYSAALAADGVQRQWILRNLAVYGNHGLTLRGADPGGLYPSDIAAWVIAQCPGLQLGVIELTDATGFILPHSVYYTPVGLDQMIGDMSVAAGWHWGVWESISPLTGNPTPRCDFRPRPALGQFTAFCLRRDCETCDIREDLSQQYNKVCVNFTDTAGVAGCAIVSADNPILDQAAIATRTLILNAGTMTQATAALYGAEVLALTYAAARVAGSIQIDEAIDGPSGPQAAWLLKPGIDRLRIGDLPSFDAWGAYNDLPISRMEFTGSSSGFSTSLEVGQGASLVETLNARLASATFLAGNGG